MIHAKSPTAIVWMQAEPTQEFELLKWNPEDVFVLAKWIECERDLARIGTFGDNWDGFEASAPDQSILRNANLFLRILRDREITNPPMGVILSPNGSIAMEWMEGSSLFRAEVGTSNEVEWMLASPGRDTIFKTEALSPLRCEATEGQEWRPTPAPVGELVYTSAP